MDDPRPHAGRRPRAQRDRAPGGARAGIRGRGRLRDGRRLHALPARPAAGWRARRATDPRAGDRRADVHRPPRGRPLPEVMRSAIPELTNDVPSLPFRQGWGLGCIRLLEDVPGMRKRGLGRLGGPVQLLLLDRPHDRVTAAIFAALLPFFDLRMVETLLSSSRASTPSSAPPAAVAPRGRLLGTPLPKKLGIKARGAARAGVRAGRLPRACAPAAARRGRAASRARGPLDVIVFFTKRRAELERRFDTLRGARPGRGAMDRMAQAHVRCADRPDRGHPARGRLPRASSTPRSARSTTRGRA